MGRPSHVGNPRRADVVPTRRIKRLRQAGAVGVSEVFPSALLRYQLAAKSTVPCWTIGRATRAAIKDARAETLPGNVARLGFELIGPIRAASHPRPPAARITRGLQAEATTCRSPGSMDCPGFFFRAVNGLPTTFGACCYLATYFRDLKVSHCHNLLCEQLG